MPAAVDQDAVKSVGKSSIRENMQNIADVDHKCAGNRRNENPSEPRSEDLEAICFALVEDGEEGGVGVWG